MPAGFLIARTRLFQFETTAPATRQNPTPSKTRKCWQAQVGAPNRTRHRSKTHTDSPPRFPLRWGQPHHGGQSQG
uniref:Uncharacterized protein n=1 Tax=Rhizophora mucronata TaxID=61149 RepID=A0A2P2QP80_RHIMU